MTETNETTKPVIEIADLSKSYGLKKALDGVSFQVNKGEIMGFLGPNGAGKSTTMNILTGYIAPSGGRVLIDGMDIADDPLEAKRKIGYLPEQPPLYTDMTVEEYLEFVYDLKKVRGEKKDHLKSIMDRVKISHVKGRLIRNLSKGYKQRVGLAQALIGDPDILILDEPTVGLDPQQIMEIREVISEVGRERTVILSTHIMQEVMAVCDSYTIINKGKIAASGSLDTFSGRDAKRYRLRIKAAAEAVLSAANRIEYLTDCTLEGCLEEGTVDLVLTAQGEADVREAIFAAFAEAKLPVLLFEPATQTLEELFMQAISNDPADTLQAETEVDE